MKHTRLRAASLFTALALTAASTAAAGVVVTAGPALAQGSAPGAPARTPPGTSRT